MSRAHVGRIAITAALLAAGAPAMSASEAGAFHVVHIADFTDHVRAAQVVDVNGDGVDDLAVASDCSVHALIGHGDGTFAAPTSNSVGTDTCSGLSPWLTSGDVDDDDAIDLILTRGDESKVWVFRGHGDGTFAAAVSYPTATGDPALGVASADLNGDGRDDIVFVEKTEALSFPTDLGVLLAKPTGGFDPAVRYGQSFRIAENLTVGHIDSDPNVDVVAGVQRCDLALQDCRLGVIEFAGNGDGTLGQPIIVDGIAQTAGQFVQTADGMPTAMLTASLRGLPHDDVIVTSNLVQSLLSASDGTLTANPAHNTIAGGRGDVGDLDQDGAPDVALAATATGAQISVLLGDGAGDFDVEGTLQFPAPLLSFADTQITDADGDRWPDLLLVTTSGAHDEVDLMLNTPTGAVDPNELDFGTIPTGSRSAPQTITVFNAGVRPLQLGAATAHGPFAISADGCSTTTLDILDSCDIRVTFAPTTAGQSAGQLTVASDDPDGPLQASLTGMAQSQSTGGGITTGPPATQTTVAPDRTPPTLKASIVYRKLKKVLRKGLAMRIGCSEACSIVAKVTLARTQARALGLRSPKPRLVVGRSSAKLTAPGSRTLTAKLSRSLRKAATHARRLDLTLTVNAMDAAGNKRALVQRIRLR